MCQDKATASDLPFYDIFAPTKISSFEVSDDVIACDLWFGPPLQSKILATLTIYGDIAKFRFGGNLRRFRANSTSFVFALSMNEFIMIFLPRTPWMQTSSDLRRFLRSRYV